MDPLDLSQKYGADALRFTLAAMAAQGRDVKLSESRIAGYRNFATKLWNASKFLEINNCKLRDDFDPRKVKNSINIWIISQLEITTEKVGNSIKSYRFNDAADSIYKFIWNSYCDWYLELIKPSIQKDNTDIEANEMRETANWVLCQANSLLNPFMPYITETLNEKLFKSKDMLIRSSWPSLNILNNSLNANTEIIFLINILTEVRSIKSELNVSNKAKVRLLIKNTSSDLGNVLVKYIETINRIGKLSSTEIINHEFPKGSSQTIVGGISIALHVDESINLDEEYNRLEKEKLKIILQIEKSENKLNNKNFIERAPLQIINEIKQRLKVDKQKQIYLNEVKLNFKNK